jgi:hypothetical protein
VGTVFSLKLNIEEMIIMKHSNSGTACALKFSALSLLMFSISGVALAQQQVVIQTERTIVNTSQALEEVDRSVEEVSAGELTVTPDHSTGVVLVTDVDEATKEVKEYAFMPDVEEVTQTDTAVQENFSIDEDGFVQVTTATGLQIPLRPAPKDVRGVSKLIDGGEVTLGDRGDVSMSLPEQALEGKMTVGMFDSAVVEPPAGLSSGVHLTDDKNGWVVYEDGTAQQVSPTFPEPKAFIEAASKVEGVSSIRQKANGTFVMEFEGRTLIVKPRFGTRVRDMKWGESTEPSVVLNDDGSVTFSVVIDSSADNVSRLRGRTSRKTETDGDIDEQ